MGGRAQQHAMRNLFRVDDDSSSSGDDDDDNNEVDDDIGQSDMTLSHAISSQQPSVLTTVTQRIQHVELEMCTVGGSIEHRLWPAATFLTSYMLADNIDQCHQSRHHNSTTDLTNQIIHQNVQTILDHFRYIVATNSTKSVSERKGLKVLELGAGIGFTSLELAYHAFHKSDINQKNHILEFLMTDLSSALPLLQRNQQRNFGTQNSSIRVQKLEWGNHDDIENAISWCRNIDTNQNHNETPLLILGTDCVYWESLHDILETTIASLLQNATPNSICLLANVRRWKRDTNFFQYKFGQFTSNQYGRLHCTCIHEQVARTTIINASSIDDPDDNSNMSARENELDNNFFGHQQEQREVIRIYAVQWITKDSKPQE